MQKKLSFLSGTITDLLLNEKQKKYYYIIEYHTGSLFIVYHMESYLSLSQRKIYSMKREIWKHRLHRLL